MLYPDDRYLLIYDSDCGICVNFKRMIDFLDARKEIAFFPLRDADDAGLLSSIPISLRKKSFHLRMPGGGLLSGAEALPELMGQLPGGGPLSSVVTRVPPGKRVVRFLYRNVSRLHERGSCAYVRTIQS